MKTPSDKQAALPHNVQILFVDERINDLFSELVTVQGFKSEKIYSVKDLKESCPIITEARYLTELTPKQRTRTLAVGDRAQIGKHEGVVLTRPLTEEKVAHAFSQLFGEDIVLK